MDAFVAHDRKGAAFRGDEDEHSVAVFGLGHPQFFELSLGVDHHVRGDFAADANPDFARTFLFGFVDVLQHEFLVQLD
jgi:hypothetical protein